VEVIISKIVVAFSGKFLQSCKISRGIILKAENNTRKGERVCLTASEGARGRGERKVEGKNHLAEPHTNSKEEKKNILTLNHASKYHSVYQTRIYQRSYAGDSAILI
jgi:hypothetical protein